jgi:hypothetical protein
MTQNILLCHGLDTRSPYYAQTLIDNLATYLSDVPHEVIPLYLGDVFEQDLDVWQQQQKTAPDFPHLEAHAERIWMQKFVGDMYQFDNWRQEFLDQVDRLTTEGPLHVVAHSWGCVFAVEDLLPLPHIQCVSLTLHGSPLDLYRLSAEISKYNFVMPTKNWFHPMDWVGGPMAHCSNATDHVINDAGPTIDWLDNIESLLLVHDSHRAGWQSKAMAQCIADTVRAAAGVTK